MSSPETFLGLWFPIPLPGKNLREHNKVSKPGTRKSERPDLTHMISWYTPAERILRRAQRRGRAAMASWLGTAPGHVSLHNLWPGHLT